MAEKILGPGGSTRRRRFLLAPMLAVAALAVFVIAGSAVATTVGPPACTNPATLAGSAFEIDTSANLVVDTANCLDWANGSNYAAGVLAKGDKPSGSGDDAFGQGTAENDANPTIVAGSIPPNKSDLKAFGITTEAGEGSTANPSGKFLQLFWSRVQNPSGTTNMDFELNQKFCDPTATPTNCANNSVTPPETPIRTSGDKLITYDLSKGGTVPSISIRTWLASGAWSAATVISGGANALALGSVNTSAITTGPLGSQDPYTFGEASVAFSALFSGSTTCGSFGSAYLKSRSSDSFTSEVKDFVAPEGVHISNCTTLATTASGPVTIGTAISDSATLTGATSTATGSITFKLYGPFTATDANTDTCVDSGTGANLVATLGPIAIGSPNGSGNYVVASGNTTPTAVGRYQWVASYSGDSNNAPQAGACKDAGEASVVNKKQPAISTTASGSVTIGTAISDSATLSGATSDATGSITFKLYGPFTATDATTDTCVDPGGTGTANLVTTLGPIAIGSPNTSGNYVVPSGNYTPTAVGRYQWVASYNGDAKNLPIAGACKNSGEASVVNKAPSTIGTAQTITPQDSATLSATAGGTPTGSVTFKLYGPDNANCDPSGPAAKDTETVALGADGTAKTNNSFAVSSALASTYKWLVSYPGDGTHDGVTSACGTEHFDLTIANS
jgi:hypothetical protein